MPDDYAYDPAWAYGYDPSYGAGYQSLPADTSMMVPASDYGVASQYLPADTTAMVPTAGMIGPLSSLGYTYGDDGSGYEDTPVAYSPETLAYFDKLNAYIGGRNPTYGSYSWAMPAQSHTFGGNSSKGLTDQTFADEDRVYTRYTPESIYSPYVSKPVEENALYQFNLPSSGNKGSTGSVRVSYNTPIALVDNRTGKLVYSGTGFDAAEKVAAMARQLTQEGGSKAKWSIYTAPPGATDVSQFKQVAEETQNKGILGALGTILPIAASFIPGFGQLTLLPKMAIMAGAGGLGAALAGNDILKGALLSGATAGLVNAPILSGGGSLASGISKALSSVGQGAVQGGLNAAGEIVVPGINALTQAGGTALGQGALNAIGNSLITSTGAKVPTDVTSSNMGTGSVPTDVAPSSMGTGSVPTSIGGAPLPLDGITVLGGQFANPAAIAAAQGATTGALSTVADNVSPAENPITVKGKPVDQVADTTTGSLSSIADLATATDNVSPAENPITVKGKPVDQVADTTTGALTGVTNAVADANLGPEENPITVKGKTTNQDTTTPGLYTPSIIETAALTGLSPQEVLDASTSDTKPPKSTLEKISDYMQLAGLGVGLLGNLGGGGGSGTSGKMPGGFGSGSGVYSATLPTPGQNGAFAVGGLDRGTGAGGIGGVTPPGGDYTRFGMGSATRAAPSNIPQYGGVNPPGFNTQTWEWLGPQTGVAKDITDQLAALPSSAAPAQPEKKLAMGGYAVGGPGDGRSDEIPAMLSDGEYVIDAETVALLGNGSNKAGAQQLDKFRANIRKHKGRELARGQFSVKAKAPDAYLPKGRS